MNTWGRGPTVWGRLLVPAAAVLAVVLTSGCQWAPAPTPLTSAVSFIPSTAPSSSASASPTSTLSRGQELQALQDRITADADWMRGIPAVWVGVGIIGGSVDLEISSANPMAETYILAHYGVTADVLKVYSDGTGIRLSPRGTIRGTVVTAAGLVPGPNQLQVDWAGEVAGGECGIGDMGYGVLDTGRFELPCAAGGWTIRVLVLIPNADWLEVGRGHVLVPAGGTVGLRITLDPGTDLNPFPVGS